MIKYIIGAILFLVIVIGVTVWFSQNTVEPTESIPEIFTPLPIVPVTVVETPETFTELLPNTPTNLFQKVLDQMHLDTYIVVSCKASQNKEKAVLITAKYVESESGNNFNAAIQAVSDWEPSILYDIGAVIFPNITDSELSQPVIFSAVPNTPYRIAPVTISNVKTALHYGWESNYVVFASTKECLGEILSTVQEGA